MRKFNLKDAKQGAELCTVDGHDAKVLLFDRSSKDFPLVVILDNKNVYYYTNDGQFYKDRTSEKDLRMK